MKEDIPYLAVKNLILNGTCTKALFVEGPHGYSLVGGHVKVGESILFANHRELREELGLLPAQYKESPYAIAMKYKEYLTILVNTELKVPFNLLTPRSEVKTIKLVRLNQVKNYCDFWVEPLKKIWEIVAYKRVKVPDLFNWNGNRLVYSGTDGRGRTLVLERVPF